jgi:hypothetical protein
LKSNHPFLPNTQVNDATLHSFFETNYGPVIECKLIMDKQTGKSKGYRSTRPALRIHSELT